MQERDIPVIETAEPTPRPARRPYERPEIIDYGSVCELTRGAGTKTADMMSGTRRA